MHNLEKEVAIFAGGCFWCVEAAFDTVAGVIAVNSGYTGGDVENPSYAQVSSGVTGHREAVQVIFDPGVVSYRELLDIFWHNIDPLDNGGQFNDRGESYHSAIFYTDEMQKALAEKSRGEVERLLMHKVVTEILPAKKFYLAEDYHQQYHKKFPFQYNTYRRFCGRDSRLKELWKDLP